MESRFFTRKKDSRGVFEISVIDPTSLVPVQDSEISHNGSAKPTKRVQLS